jgi:hypothetical protein
MVMLILRPNPPAIHRSQWRALSFNIGSVCFPQDVLCSVGILQNGLSLCQSAFH